MRNKAIQILLLAMVIFMTVSCRKKTDDQNNSDTPTPPAEVKKYAWAVGTRDSTGYGTILFSSDYGDTWTRQGQGSLALQGVDISDIWAVDENNVWAIGGNNTVLKTSNSGQTWEKVAMPVVSSNPYLNSICIVNKTNIWISGSNGVVYNSTNNGSTWTLFDTTFFQNGQLQGIWAISPQKVFVVGGTNTSPETGIIDFTLDGGATWDSIVLADNYNFHEWIGVCSAGNTIVVYGSKSHYAVSTDGGTTWENDSLYSGGIDGADINHLIMLDAQTWWGAFDNGQIFITTDGGTSWNAQTSGEGGSYLVGIDAFDSQLALVVGTPLASVIISPILKTTNGGTTWGTPYKSRSCLWKVTFIKK
jgi:photosystem II stability/assembly factor-like uncharacterized protein